MLFGFTLKRDTKGGRKSHKTGRPTREVAAERRKEALADKENELKQLKVEREIAKLRVGLHDKGIDLDDLTDLNGKLGKIGLKIMPVDPNILEEGPRAWIRDLADSDFGKALGFGMANFLMNRHGQQPQAAETPPALQLNPAPSAPPPAVEAPATQAPSPNGEDGSVSLQSKFLIGLLGKMPPAAAAQWLLEQPQAHDFAVRMGQTEEAGLPALMDELGASVPVLAGVAQWAKGRREWLSSVAAELRRTRSAGTGF